MSSQPRRVLTPRKRKEAEVFSQPKPASPAATAEPSSPNRLLAGYLANEFLTKGTLFGQRWDPGRAEAVPLSAAAEPRRGKPIQASEADPEPRRRVAKQPQSYAEVATLLKGDGAHIPGVVNPTQLVQWIQM